MEKILTGIAASPGYAFGKLQILKKRGHAPFEKHVSVDRIDREIERFRQSVESYLLHIDRLIDASHDELSAALFDAYRELLADDEIVQGVPKLIRSESFSAEHATTRVFDEIIDEMQLLPDDYARQRADDFRQMKNALLILLSGGELAKNISLTFSSTILAGNDLAPAETSTLDRSRLAGIVSETGGLTSHIAIFSQNAEIPAVLAVHGITDALHDGAETIIDGCEGIVVVFPTPATRECFFQKQEEYRKTSALLEDLQDLPAVSRSGYAIELAANIGEGDEIDLAIKYGADGVGLFRTEFLLNRSDTLPTEEEQFRIFRKTVERMPDQPVTIRTFDIGGDKPLPSFPMPQEPNPFLGWRACRIYENHPELILPQLRAVLRASCHGRVQLMFPMIISREEVTRMLQLFETAKQQLRDEKTPYSQDIPVGIMIETPAAALIIEDLLPMIDFCSIGTNDLTQYTLAVDRGNDRVAPLYNAGHPAVLQLIRQVVESANRCDKEVSLCGEIAGQLDFLPFFRQIGLKKLSMTPMKIPVVKNAVRNGCVCPDGVLPSKNEARNTQTDEN